jgi:hypothetical protein
MMCPQQQPISFRSSLMMYRGPHQSEKRVGHFDRPTPSADCPGAACIPLNLAGLSAATYIRYAATYTIRIYYQVGCYDGFDGALAVAQVVDKLVRSRLIGFREEHLLHQLVADNDATLVSTFREVRHFSPGCRNSKL